MKTILISGGSSGIGKKIAKFLSTKYKVVISSSDAGKLKVVADELGVRACPCDITKESEIKNLLDCLQGHSPDVLINCAAVLGPVGKFAENNFSKWEKAIAVDLIGNARLIHALIPVLKKSKSPKIINVGGGGAAYSRPYHTAYAAAKTAMVRLTEILADEYTEIDINIIAPGAHKTAMWAEETHDKEPEKWADENKLFGLVDFLINSNGVTGRFIHIENDWKSFTKDMEEERFKLRRTN